MKSAVFVPARLASTRLHQKLLIEIHGKPVVLWVADRIRSQVPDIPLYFAVDDERFVELLADAGFDAIMTGSAHTCGTDRIAEANRTVQAEQVINVQGDQPLVTAAQIRQLLELLEGGAQMATLGVPLQDYAAFCKREPDAVYRDPRDVKLICDKDGHAVYFSRAAIPHFRDAGGAYDEGAAGACPVLIHEGLYGYSATFLETFSQLPPGPLETGEKLEMLRATEHGYRIAVGISYDPYLEIDTLEQARDFEQLLEKQT